MRRPPPVLDVYRMISMVACRLRKNGSRLYMRSSFVDIHEALEDWEERKCLNLRIRYQCHINAV